MDGHTTTRGTIVAESGPDGKPLDDGPLYLQPEDGGRRLLLIDAIMAAQASIDYLAAQSRPRFLPALGQKVEVSGYRTSGTIYEAAIVGGGPPPFDDDLDAPDGG